MPDSLNITLIVGLPGSGKTYLARQLSNPDTIVIDDITSMDQLPDDGNIIITDVNFCDSGILERAQKMLLEKYGDNTRINVYYFECNPIAARRNVEYRNDGRNVEGTICRFEKIYNPSANSIKIWNPDIDGTND